MATGYTADIAKGITFRKFALDCARAFGACITIRDEPGGGEAIPAQFNPSEHHEKELAQARARLDVLNSLTSEEVARKADSHNRDALDTFNAREKEKSDLKAKYDAMLAQVKAWNPPTPSHVDMKTFMVEQIEKSIQWDCSPGSKPKELDAKTWLRTQIESALWDIGYHEREHAAEVLRARQRTEWVKALRDSLPE